MIDNENWIEQGLDGIDSLGARVNQDFMFKKEQMHRLIKIMNENKTDKIANYIMLKLFEVFQKPEIYVFYGDLTHTAYEYKLDADVLAIMRVQVWVPQMKDHSEVQKFLAQENAFKEFNDKAVRYWIELNYDESDWEQEGAKEWYINLIKTLFFIPGMHISSDDLEAYQNSFILKPKEFLEMYLKTPVKETDFEKAIKFLIEKFR